MSTHSFGKTSIQTWRRETAATRHQRRIGRWLGAVALLVPLLFYAAGTELVILLYLALGAVALLVGWGWHAQQRWLKYCPLCQAPNPVDAQICQRCGVRPMP
jgi:hypothetical protein